MTLDFFELASSDLERARKFYTELLGWNFRKTSSSEFLVIEGAGVSGGMILDPTPTSGRPNTKVFFRVDDLNSKVALASRLGATIILTPTQVSPVMVIAEFRDLDGNVVGMISGSS